MTINTLPPDIFNHIFSLLTLFELAFVARVCKVWHARQSHLAVDRTLYNIKIAVLIRYPRIEAFFHNGTLKTECINKLKTTALANSLVGLREISSRFLAGLHSIVLPYGGKLYLLTLDPLFIPSFSRLHGLQRDKHEIFFYCHSPKCKTRRRYFKTYQLSYGDSSLDIPQKPMHHQILDIGGFIIGEEEKRQAIIRYYLLPLITPYIFIVKGPDLIAIYSVPTPYSPLGYNKFLDSDVYIFPTLTLQVMIRERQPIVRELPK